MTTRIWHESGGDTGGGEVYTEHADSCEVGHLDWDDLREGSYTHADVFAMLVNFGDIMPRATMRDLLDLLVNTPREMEVDK